MRLGRSRHNDEVETIVFDIDDIRHMLIAPERNIYSTNPIVYMGQSVVDRLLERFKQEKGLNRRNFRLVLLMPREKIAPYLSEDFEAALDRFTATKIGDNKRRMAAIRREGMLQIPYALVFLTTSMGLGLLFGSEYFRESLPIFSVISEGAFIVGWVALWGPVETLLFGHFPYLRENRALRALERMKIEIRPREDAENGSGTVVPMRAGSDRAGHVAHGSTDIPGQGGPFRT